MQHSPLLPARKVEQPQYFYSPAFQCYTSPPFYKSLLSELQYVSSFIDLCKPQSREIVWKQLFILLGAKPVLCSKVFGPVLKAWAEAPTINLLAIELLYLSFAISLDKNPDLIKDVSPKRTPELLPSPMRVPNGMKMRLSTGNHNNSPTRNHIQRREVSIGSPERKEIPPPKPKPPTPPPPTPPTNRSKGSSQVDFSKLLQLQAWKDALDSQPQSIKTKIWRVWEGLGGDSSSHLLAKSFSSVLDDWVKDLAANSEAIFNLHSAVECISNNCNLNLNSGGTNSSTNTPSSSQSHIQSRPTLPPPTRTAPPSSSLHHHTLPPFRIPTGDPSRLSQYASNNLPTTLRPITSLPSLPQKRPLQPHTMMDPKRMKP